MNEYVNLYSAQLEKTSRALAANKWVLSSFANVSLDSDEVRRSTRRLFQVAGPATAKSLGPIVVLVHGTTSAPLFANRSCHLPTTDETGVHTSAKYDGARPWRHLKVIIASLKVIRWQTVSQWSWCSTWVMWSNFLVPVTTRAAAFWMMHQQWHCGSKKQGKMLQSSHSIMTESWKFLTQRLWVVKMSIILLLNFPKMEFLAPKKAKLSNKKWQYSNIRTFRERTIGPLHNVVDIQHTVDTYVTSVRSLLEFTRSASQLFTTPPASFLTADSIPMHTWRQSVTKKFRGF